MSATPLVPSPLSAQAIARIKGGLVLLLGVGMLAIALQGLARGQLPLGRGGRQRTVVRAEQPVLFWFMFALDVVVGVLALHYSLAWL